MSAGGERQALTGMIAPQSRSFEQLLARRGQNSVMDVGSSPNTLGQGGKGPKYEYYATPWVKIQVDNKYLNLASIASGMHAKSTLYEINSNEK